MARDEDAGALPLHALLTPSHAVLCDEWFLPSVPPDCVPLLHEHADAPETFAQGRWHRIVGRKLDIVLETIVTSGRDARFVMSDVDVRFYGAVAGDLRDRMHGVDVLFQNNRPTLPEDAENVCTGFMVIRASERTRAFFTRARAVLEAADDPAVGDQRACIATLQEAPHLIRWGFLPVTYWSPGDPRGRWHPGMSLDPPAGMLLHHANHTVGVANKVAQLRAVATVMEGRRRARGGATLRAH
jgi:hypothetical protein